MVHSKEQSYLTEAVPEETHTSKLLEKHFKPTILDKHKMLRENMDKRFNETKKNNIWTKEEYQQRDRNYKKELNRNYGAEKHND